MTVSDPSRPMVIGHRGARGEWPENTLEGIRNAIAAGCDMIEIDVQLARDGVAVVTHDAALNPDLTRMGDGGWLDRSLEIRALTSEALQSVDVGRIRPGSALARRFPQQRALPPARIPRLSEVLDLARDTGTRLLIEIKDNALQDRDGQRPEALASRTARDVLSAGLCDRTIFQSFDWRSLRRVRESAPEATLCGLSCHRDAEAPGNVFTGSVWLDGHARLAVEAGLPAAIAEAGFDYWAPAHTDLTDTCLEDARSRNLGVFVWTVNEADQIDALLAKPISGIITDYPTLAVSRRRIAAQ